jgi:hypothetical protein
MIGFRFEMWSAIQGRRLSHLDVAVTSYGRMRVNRAAVHVALLSKKNRFLYNKRLPIFKMATYQVETNLSVKIMKTSI